MAWRSDLYQTKPLNLRGQIPGIRNQNNGVSFPELNPFVRGVNFPGTGGQFKTEWGVSLKRNSQLDIVARTISLQKTLSSFDSLSLCSSNNLEHENAGME